MASNLGRSVGSPLGLQVPPHPGTCLQLAERLGACSEPLLWCTLLLRSWESARLVGAVLILPHIGVGTVTMINTHCYVINIH